MRMPAVDVDKQKRRDLLLSRLRRALPEGLISDEEDRRAFDTDAMSVIRQIPLVVVLPASTGEIAAVLRICRDLNVKVVPRGAGTGLSGGAIPLVDGVLLGTSKLNRILEIDIPNHTVTCQPGVTNLSISEAVSAYGLYYAPDPSSQIACTIGGNVAENAGGVHCLKYGVTANHVTGLELVTIDGEVVRVGGKHLDAGGYDLLAAMTGSEGLLGVLTEVTVRVIPHPQTAQVMMIGFASIETAGDAVAAILAAGIVPAGLELMDRLCIDAVEAFMAAGYPRDVEALMLVELDGDRIEVLQLCNEVEGIVAGAGAVHVRRARDEAERRAFWAGRKAAFPAMGRISPDYLCMDGTIPRRRLSEVLGRIRAMQSEFGLRVANVFHAGDGNLHPLILFDANAPGELERTLAFGAAILRLCVEVGGVLSGEHGIGLEKRDLMPVQFSDTDLTVQQRLKCVFDPHGLMNPGKVFPTLHRCAELGLMHVHAGRLPFAELPRF